MSEIERLREEVKKLREQRYQLDKEINEKLLEIIGLLEQDLNYPEV